MPGAYKAGSFRVKSFVVNQNLADRVWTTVPWNKVLIYWEKILLALKYKNNEDGERAESLNFGLFTNKNCCIQISKHRIDHTFYNVP